MASRESRAAVELNFCFVGKALLAIASVAVNVKGSTTWAAESPLRAHIIPKLGNYRLPEITTRFVQGFVAYSARGGRSHPIRSE